jgi:hypothetical protein
LDSGAQALDKLNGGRSPAYAPSRVRKAQLMMESLEPRRLLATDVFVNDNWEVTDDVDMSGGLSFGDEVANTGFGDDGTVTGLTFGDDAFLTISDALAAVTDGDNIHVITGTYSTPTTVNKSVSLLGAKAGVSGIGRDPNATSDESIMSASGGSLFVVAANDVTIDGFLFRDASTGAAAVALASGTTGHLVQNNVFARNIFGLSVASNNTDVLANQFFENNRSGANRSQGVNVNSGATGVVISGNYFAGHDDPLAAQPGAVVVTGAGTDATLTGNDFIENTIGVRLSAGGTATLNTNNFDAGGINNATDLRLDAGAGGVLLGNGANANKFAGDTYFIDNLSTNNINAVGSTFFDAPTHFRIEDMIHHRMDTDLGLSTGLVTWVAGNLYVTTPGGGSTDSSIQRGVDSASSGNTINIENGTYAQTINIDGRASLTLRGESTAGVVIEPTALLDWNVGSYGSSRKTAIRLNNSTAITLENVTVDMNLVQNNLHWAYLAWDSTATIQDNVFKNNLVSDVLGGYTEGGLYLRAPSYAPASRALITLEGNEIIDLGRVAVLAHDFVDVQMSDNDITRTVNDFGYGAEIGSTAAATLTNNRISGYDTAAASDGSESAGIYVENAFTSAIVTPIVKHVGLVNNEIFGNERGITIGNEFDGFAGAVTIEVDASGNNIHDNLNGGIKIADEDASAGSAVDVTFVNNTLANNGHTGYFISTDGDGDITASIQGGSVSGSAIGAVVADFAVGTTGSTYDVEVNGVAFTSNATGVRVQGQSSARVVGNTFSGVIGIDVNGGTALVEGNQISGGNNDVGIRISNNALVDAGDNSASDYTGLGSSTGNNVLTGYTGSSGHFAVENLNTVANGNRDVLAENNDWGPVSIVSVIEGVIYDDTDNPLNTQVDFDPPSTALSPAPAKVYVDDSWAGTALGDDPDAGDGIPMQFGVDAFAVIQQGVDAVQVSGEVEVRPGTYAENVIVHKSLELYGTDQATVIVQPSFTGADVVGGSLAPGHSTVFLIQANDVEIHHLTVDGDNPALASGIIRNGADIDARNGFNTDHNTVSLVTGLEIHHTTVRNIYLRGIYSSTDFGTFDFHHNTVSNVTGGPESIAIFNYGGSGNISNNVIDLANDAIAANWSVGTTIIGNQVTNSASGIHTDNAGGYGGPSVADLIQGNTVSDGAGSNSYGIFTFASYTSPVVKSNIITDVNTGLAALGSFGGTPTFELNQVTNTSLVPGSTGALVTTSIAPFGSVDISANFLNNTISGADTGIHVEEEAGFTASINVTGGSISGGTNGVTLVDGDAVVSGTSITGNSGAGVLAIGGDAQISGGEIHGNAVGIDFENGATGSVTGVDLDDATDDNDVDLLISSLAGSVTIGAGNQFAGDDLYIDLESTQSHDLSSNGTTFDETNNFRIEDKMRHRMDTDLPPTNGLVTWVAGNLYVTTPEGGSTDSSIQRGVEAASNGDTVNVEAGTYTEQVDITKAITLAGAGASTVIKSPASLVSTFNVGSTNFFPVVTVEGTDATVRDLTIDGDGQGAANNRFVGLAYYNAGGVADNLTVTGVRHSPLDGVQNGLAIYARVNDATPRSLTISNSIVEDYQKNGITVAGADLSVEISGNTITGAGDTTLIAQNGVQVSEGAVANIHNNAIAGHQYSGPAGGPNFLTDTQSTGVLLFGAGAGTIVDDNDIDGNDIGVYSFGSDLTIISNRLGLSAANRYEGIIVDEGNTDVVDNTINGGNVGVLVVSFGGNSLDSEANLGANVITGAGIGIQAVDDDTLDGVQPVIVSANSIIDSTIAGMLLADSRTVVAGGEINSSAPGAVGIEVSGGAAVIEGVDLSGNHVGLRVRDDARVDAGDVSNSDYTGLGASSAGNNNFTGYTGADGNYAIENLNLVAAANLDVLAQTNDFGPFVIPSFIENVIYDDTDNPSNTEVIFSPAQNQQAAPAIVYVDDDWADTALGADPDGAGPATAYGVDAFAVMQDGINTVTIGGQVIVFAGQYFENVEVPAAQDGLTITGPNAGVAGDDLGRGPEALIRGAGSGFALTILGANTIIDGMAIADDDASDNGESIGVAIGAQGSGSEFRNNVVSGFITGLYLASGHQDGVIEDNLITGNANGILIEQDLNNTDIADNSIVGNNLIDSFWTGRENAGIRVLSFYNGSGNTISGNTIAGSIVGIDHNSPNSLTYVNNTIAGANIGVNIVDGASANLVDNDINDNVVGIRAATGGSVTLSGTNFDGGLAGDDNDTDLLIESSAGTVTIGANNSFAGNTFFIDNQSTQSFDLTGIGTAFDESNNFRIEDQMHHRVDTDLPLTTGLITWVADSLFVTTPAAGSTDSSIQRAIDAANPGDTIFVEAGTYTENLTIGKDINLVGEVDGMGAPLVNLQPAAAGDLITISGSTFGDDERVSIANFNLNGLAGLGDRGIHVTTTADFDTLAVDNANFTGFDFNAIIVNGPATGSLLDNVEISDSMFTNNGIAGGGGSGDLQFFLYNGDATLSDLVLVGSSVGTTGPRLGIQFRGTGDAAGVGTQPMGNVTLDNVDVSGDYVTQMIGIQRYSDVNNLSLNDVKLGGATSSITGTFGASLRLDAVGAGTLASPATLDLGNTHFRGLDPLSAIPFEIEIAPDNTHTFLRADATGTTWTVGGVDVAASALTLPQAFAVEDRILHYVDLLHPTHGAFKGFVEVQNGKAFVSDTHDGSIRRGVEVVDANGTVHVSAGTFTESVLVDKTVTLLGAQAGVDARGRAASESTITSPVADETLALVNITAPNVTIDGFTIDGDGPVAGGVPLLDGVTESNAARGIVVDADNAQVLNNRVMNTYRRGVQFWVNAASAPIGGLVNQNELSVIGADVATPANSGDAILAFSDPTVTNNKVVTARTGITFIQVYAPNVTPISISGNEIDAINGIALNETSSSLPAITMSGNTVTTDDGGVGLLLWSVGGALNASGNSFTGSGNGDIGVYGWTGTSTVPMNVTLSGGSITNYETGVHLTNDEATFGPALADTTVTLDGVSISGGDTGLLVEDAGTSAFAVKLGLTGNTAIAGGVTGIVLDGASAELTGDTLSDTALGGQSGDYIRLANGAYGAPGLQTDVIDATNVTFDGLLASAMTSAQRVALEGKIFHEPDDATLGFVRVDAFNDNPVAEDDLAVVPEDSIDFPIDVLANDEDVDGDTLTITAVTQGANGTVAFTATGVTYTPNADYFGPDSFSYTISDGNGGFDTATVNVTVTPVNDDPVANDDSATVNEDSTNNFIDVLHNDDDGVDSGEMLEVIGATDGANGTVTFTATGVFYTPNPDFFGPDSFTYTISDGNGGTDTATVNVTVIQVGPSFLGTNGNDTYLVRLDATGTTIEVYNSDPASGTPIYTTPLAGASELTFDTLAGDDRLIIDLVNGNPIPANDISLIAGAHGGAGDQLEIRGAGTGSGSFAASATEVGAGLMTLDGREIDLAGVEAIDAASLNSFAVVTPNAADTLSVEILSDGTNVLTGTSGAISLPTVTLGDLNTIVIDAAANDAGGGDDDLTVESGSTATDLPFIEFHSGTGTNTLTVEGETSRIDATVSSGGSLATVVAEDATLYTHRFRQTSLTLSEGSRAIVLPDGTNSGASVLEVLDIANGPGGPTAQLDLNDNDLILRATAATKDAIHAAIEANIVSAQNGIDANFVTMWDGQGITSSAARTSNVASGFDLVGLGVIRNSDLTITTGLPHGPYTTFDGQPVGPDDVLVKFTYTGDGNFDGQVDFDDYAAMDSAFFGLIPNLGWATGDINFDGDITFDDYSVVDQAYFFQGAPLSGGGAVNVAIVNAESRFETGPEEVFALLGAEELSATPTPAPTHFAAAADRGAVADDVVAAIRTAGQAEPRSTAVRDDVLASLDKLFDSNENGALQKKSLRPGRFFRVFQ